MAASATAKGTPDMTTRKVAFVITSMAGGGAVRVAQQYLALTERGGSG